MATDSSAGESAEDRSFRRSVALGRVLGPVLVIVPMALIVFLRSAMYLYWGTDTPPPWALPALGIVVALGALVAIWAFASHPFDRG